MSDQEAIARALDGLQPQMARETPGISDLIISRHELEIVSLYRADRIHAPAEGRAALVATAGVPGAGKSSFVEENIDVERYFHIDPDKVRVHCLEIAQREGYLDQWLHRRLPDGQPPRLGELSTLVQKASTSISDAMRDIALNNRENIIMEGTLQWSGHPNAYLGDPDLPNVAGLLTPGRGYGGFEVYAVEVPQRVALEQAANRWWEKRAEGSPLARYMPPRAIDGMYPTGQNGHGYSSTLDTALGMVNHPNAGQYELARVNVLDRMETTQPVMVRFDHQPGRSVAVDDVAQRVRTERGRSPSHVDKPTDRRLQQKEIRDKVQQRMREKKGPEGPKPPRADPPSQRGPKL